MISRLLGRDRPIDLVHVVGFFVAYWVLDALSRRLARLSSDDVERVSLLWGAVLANPIAAVIVVVVALGLVVRSPARLLAGWDALDHGSTLRWLAAPMLFLIAWQGALYEYNFLADRTHLLDRALILALALACIFRPAALVPFVIQSRIVSGQFDIPFGTTAAQAIDVLLIILLAAIAGAHLVHVVTARTDTAPVLLVMAAAIAAHLFIPGRAKLQIGWLGAEDLSFVPLNGWVAGWLGQTDGGWARWAGDLIARIDVPMQLATMLVELGAVLAVAHHRLMRLWLPLVMVFHLVNFALFGFWFLGWLAVEVALSIVFWRRDLSTWVGTNTTPARAVVAMVAVGLGGATLFHPPGLAWFDTPVAYGLEIEAVGESGARYNVPAAAFSPFDQEIVLNRVQLGPTRNLVGSYGVLASSDRLPELEAMTDVAMVAAAEDRRPDGETEPSERFFAAFVANANRRAVDRNLIDLVSFAAPASKTWTGRAGPTYRFQEPIVRLDVVRVTSLQTADEQQFERQPVLALEAGAGASPTIVDVDP